MLSEIVFKTSLSGGPGGQHVNKTETKVSLYWALETSSSISMAQRDQLLKALKNQITKDGYILIHCSKTRSQHKNKQLVIKRLFQLIENSLKTPKKRKATKPSKLSKLKRLNAKQQHSDKKLLRKKPKIE